MPEGSCLTCFLSHLHEYANSKKVEGNEPLRGELESMVNWEKPIENVYRSIRIVFNVVTSLRIFFC